MVSRELSAVVLAAGEGRRLTPLTNTRPKPMLPVANRPILEYVLRAIRAAGIDTVYFVVGYRQERIRNYFGDGDDWDISLQYIEQQTQLGTGHAILQAEASVDSPFLVFNGDRVVDPSIAKTVVDAHAENVQASMALTRVENPTRFGVTTVDDGRLIAIEEKPHTSTPSAMINAGVYCFDEQIFDRIRQTDTVGGELAITTTLNEMADEGAVATAPYSGRWLDVTYLWDVPLVNASVIEETDRLPSDRIHDSVSIAADADLAQRASIGPHTTIGGGTAIGPSARIGPNCVIENSVVMDDAVIEAGTVVRDAVVGANAHLGPHVTIPGGPADVVTEGKEHRNVRLGGVVGDNADIGGGATIAPGAIIGNNASVAAGTRVRGRIAPETFVQGG